MLPTQLIDIPFTGGLDAKLDSVIVDKARLLSASNYSFNQTGTLTKRDAWDLLPGGTGIVPVEMATLNGELLTIDKTTNNLYMYSALSTKLVSRGQPPYMSMSKLQVSRAVGNIAALDSASDGGGYTCFAWLQLGAAGAVSGVFTSVYEEESQTFITNNVQLSASATAGAPRVCAGNIAGAGQFFVVWGDGTNLKAVGFPATNVNSGSIVGLASTIATDYVGTAGSAPLDLITLDAVNALALVTYASTKAATSVGALVINLAMSVVAAEITAASNAFANIFSIGTEKFSASTIALVFKPSGAASATAILSWSGGVLSVAQPATGTGFPAGSGGGGVTVAFDGTSMHFFDFPFQGGAGVTAAKHALLSSGNAVTSAATIANAIQFSGGLSGPNLAGKAFVLGGKAFVPVAMTSDLQPGLFVMDTSGNIQASALYGSLAASSSTPVVGILASWGGVVPSAPVVSTNVVSLATAQQGRVSFTDGVNTTASGVTRLLLGYGRTGLGQVNLATQPTPLWHAQANNCLYFSGSYLGMYDGRQCIEAGFFHFPENIALSAAAGVGITGTFQVTAVYEWTDAQGQRHQSAPTPPVSITLANNGGIAYQAATLRFGGRATAATVVFYRTQNSGTTFFRINAPNNAIANDPAAYRVTGTDTTPTTTATADPITSNEQLYTGGGYLPNDNPVACNAIAAYQGRIIYSNAEDPQDWRFSQPASIGQGLYFNESLLGGRTPQDVGQISAFGVLDDKLIICTRTNKLWTSGQGPSVNGLGGGYSQPQLLPSGVGCIDQRTIILVPDVSVNDSPIQFARPGGMAHYSLQGIYLLGRGLTDEFLGFPVGDNLSGPVATSGISSAVLMPDRGQIRWTTSGNNPSCDIIVYDYIFGQWSTFTASLGTTCAAIWGGLYTFGSNSKLYQDTSSQGLDFGTTPIVGSFTTGWAKLSGLQGFGRLRRVVLFGPYGSNSTITVGEKVDYNTSPVGTATVSTANLKTTDGFRWQFRWHVPVQKCQAVHFLVTDTPDGTGSGAGAGFSGMTLELGVKKGPAKLPAGKST